MPGLILGIDICDDYTQISRFDPDKLDAYAKAGSERRKRF